MNSSSRFPCWTTWKHTIGGRFGDSQPQSMDRAVPSARPQRELPELPAKDASAEVTVIREQQKRTLMAALATLPSKERATVVLREIEGLSTPEVAAILGSTEGTVRSQVAKAFARLRAILNKEEK